MAHGRRVRKARRALAVFAGLGVLWPAALGAQEEDPIGIARERLDTRSGAVFVELGRLIDPDLREALDDGLPVRIQLVITLWRDGLFDDREADWEWRAAIRPRGSDGYALTVATDPEVSPLADFQSLQRALRREIAVPLRPRRRGRHYYQIRLHVETLSTEDLDELERWLAGEVDPADGPPETGEPGVVGRGVRGLFLRALGLPQRSLELRSRRFPWPP